MADDPLPDLVRRWRGARDAAEQHEAAQDLLAELVDRYEDAAAAGRTPDLAALTRDCPELRARLESELRRLTEFDRLIDVTRPHPGPPPADGEPLPAVAGYVVQALLGEGGMGVVYRARQLYPERPVALKMIRAGARASREDLLRFQTEAEAIASLHHPGIVQLFELGVHEGRPYFSLELVEGGSLARRLDGQPLPPRRAAELVRDVARAVQHAHQRGVIHRDLKPGNILLDGEGRPKITDFGLARRLQEETLRDRLTPASALVGTPCYMAPEQISNKPGEVGTHSDVYALGAVLYECLTGKPPFLDDSVFEVLNRVKTQPPARPSLTCPQVPRDLEVIALKCLEKEPAKRYAGAADLADDLQRFLDGEPIAAVPTPRAAQVWRWCRRNPVVAGLGAAVLLLVVAFAVGASLAAVSFDQKAKENERLAEQRREALEQARLEQRRAEEALEAKDRAAYVDLLARADQEWSENHLARARELLLRCPAHLRRWEWRYLERQCRPQGRLMRGHSLMVEALTFLPDGRLLSGGADGAVRLWSAEGQPLHAFEARLGPVRSVARDPAARLAAAACYGLKPEQGPEILGGVVLWELETGRRLPPPPGPGGPLTCVAFGPGGLLAAGGHDGLLRLWRARPGGWDGPHVQEMRSPLEMRAPSPINGLAFAPAERVLATVSDDGVLRFWDVEWGKERVLVQTDAHVGGAGQVAFAPLGTRLATTGADGAVRVWDWTRQAGLRPGKARSSSPGATFDYFGAAFSPDGRRLAVGDSRGEVVVWALDGGGTGDLVLRGHVGPVLAVAFRVDGEVLASGGLDHTARLWAADVNPQARVLSGHDSNVVSVAVSPDGQTVASAGPVTGGDFGDVRGEVRVWDRHTGDLLVLPQGLDAVATALAFSPDGETLAVGREDRRVTLYDARTWLVRRDLEGPGAGVSGVAFSRDGRLLAASAFGLKPGSSEVWVWELATGKGRRLPDVVGSAFAVAFSPDGRRLAAALGGPDLNGARVWDVTTGAALLTVRGHAGQVDQVQFSPDGTLLATSCFGEVRLWDAATGRLKQELKRRLGGVVPRSAVQFKVQEARGEPPVDFGPNPVCLAFSPDGRRLATGCTHDGAGEIILWDVAAGRDLLTLRGHKREVLCLAFGPDGSCLVSGSADRTVRIWEAGRE
jgi:WD40 repeat protein